MKTEDAEMGNYLDQNYAAIDGVLLSYTGDDVLLKLPGRLADMEIHTIGAGAVSESENLRQLVIPSGVQWVGNAAFQLCKQLEKLYIPYSLTSIGERAFSGCSRLTDYYVYGFRLSEKQYSDLHASSIKCFGNQFLSTLFPYNSFIKMILSQIDAKPANIASGDIKMIFSSPDADNSESFVPISVFGGSEDRCRSETNAFLQLIADDGGVEVDAECEAKNDSFLRSEKYPSLEKTIVFMFDDSKTRYENGMYYLFADIKAGYNFWQSKVPIVFGGRKYYIYRRHYLTRDKELKYIRKDAAVFSETGPVTDEKEAREVYAKYKLISIL